MLIQSTASLEYVSATVSAVRNGTPYDPSGDTAAMAFLAGGAAPTAGDFKTAIWDIDATVYPPAYRAQCLVGPGGTVTLTAGIWTVWVKVTDSPEIPVKRAGQIKIV